MAISSDIQNTLVTNHYPSDILSEENKYRKIQIIVKNQEYLSGGINTIIDKIDETYQDTKNALNSITNDRVAPADAPRQKKLNERTPKNKDLRTIYGIALPLPNELNDSQNHQWEASEGIVGSVAGNLTETSIQGVSINKVIGSLASNSGFRKPLIDPGYFQDYKGSEPRTFTFSWDFIPADSSEVDNIVSILYNLKKYTLPKSTVTGISMLSPYLFDIKIGNDRINSIINMTNVVCTSMNINFAAEGSLQFLPDGMPKLIKLEMTFAERTLVTSDYY